MILCLDVGTRRIGVAKSDALGIAAHSMPAIFRENDAKTFEALAKIIQEENIGCVLVGLPRNMNGSLGPSAEMVQVFVETLKKHISLPVEFWDERLSTVQAENVMLEGDLSRKKRKSRIDSLAAQIVLQNYLDAKRG